MIADLELIESNRSLFESRAIGARARGDWDAERAALDALHLLDRRLKGTTLDAMRVDELHSAILGWLVGAYSKANMLRHEAQEGAATELEEVLDSFVQATRGFEVEK